MEKQLPLFNPITSNDIETVNDLSRVGFLTLVDETHSQLISAMHVLEEKVDESSCRAMLMQAEMIDDELCKLKLVTPTTECTDPEEWQRKNLDTVWRAILLSRQTDTAYCVAFQFDTQVTQIN